MEVKGRFKMELEDFRKFNFYHQRASIMKLTVITFLIIFLWSFMRYGKFSAVMFFSSLIGAICFCALIYFAVQLQSKSIFDRNMLSEVEAENTINDDGFFQVSSAGTFQIPFDKLFKICETENAFYVYSSKVHAIIMQKKYFDSPSDIENFKKILSANVDGKRLKFMK